MKLMDSASFQCFTGVSNHIHVTKSASLGWMITLRIINEFEKDWETRGRLCFLIWSTTIHPLRLEFKYTLSKDPKNYSARPRLVGGDVEGQIIFLQKSSTVLSDPKFGPPNHKFLDPPLHPYIFITINILTSRSHVAVRLCSVIDHCGSCVTSLFLPHFDVLCDLLLNRRTATFLPRTARLFEYLK